MKITFIGTGYSCDPDRKNVSVLVKDSGRAHMLDCGFSSAQGYLSHSPQSQLDTVWISHFHGDHFFGLPQLILHFYMQKRSEPLSILSGINGEDRIRNALQLAYPELETKLPFPLIFIGLQPGKSLQHNGLSWQCAPVIHSQSANGLRLSNGSRSLYYSGDGKTGQESAHLMQNCNLIIHEAFSLKSSTPYHSSIEECLLLAEKFSPSRFAFIHLSKESRDSIHTSPPTLETQETTEFLFPEDGQEFDL